MEEYPIQVAARRTGLTVDTLRAWERRYHAVTPRRTANGRRVYSDEEIERLLLLRKATDGSRRIGQVASLTAEELHQLVEEDKKRAANAPLRRVGLASADEGAEGHLSACMKAVETLQSADLERQLVAARVDLPLIALITRVIAPLLGEIGERWQKGELRVAQEHLASAAVRSVLEESLSGLITEEGAPLALVTTPAGERHELGALFAAVSAASAGWRVTFLGPDLPAEEIAGAVRQSGARAVLLSLVGPADRGRVVQELARLSRLLPSGCAICVGGRNAPALARAARLEGVRILTDLDDLPAALDRLRDENG